MGGVRVRICVDVALCLKITDDSSDCFGSGLKVLFSNCEDPTILCRGPVLAPGGELRSGWPNEKKLPDHTLSKGRLCV